MDMGILFGLVFNVLMVSFVVTIVYYDTKKEMVENGTWDEYIERRWKI